MKTHTSKQKIWFRSLVLLPLLAITLYSFSDRKEVVKEISSESTDSHHTARSIDIKVFDNGTYEVDGITATKKSFVSVINQLHQDITPETRNQIINIHVNNEKAVSNEEVWFIYNSVLEYGFHRIVAYNQEIIRAKGNKPFAITSNDTQKRIKVISENQDGASRELMKEYDKLAKHYNAQSKENIHVKKNDVERMKYIYGLMSAKQKKSAEPFPNIPPPPAPKAPKANNGEKALPPPPPPPIPENATPEQKIKYQKVIDEYNRKYTVKNGMVSENPPPPPPPIPENATDAEKKKYNKAIKQYKQKTEKINRVKADNTKQLKEQKLAYAEARTAKLKNEKGELAQVRELQSKERVLKLKQEKLAYKEARAAKLKTEKVELTQVRELQSKEQVSKLKAEQLAYKEAKAAQVKKEVTQVRELQTQERNLILKEKKLALKEAQKAEVLTEKRLARVKEIQPPKSPLDFVIDMAKKDAKFFYKGEEISSDEAIKILKKNPEMNINAPKSKTGTPLVYISKEPIVIGTKGKSE